MATKEETQAYFDARNRAMERVVEGSILRRELTDGFFEGFDEAANLTERELMLAKVWPETNFGFAFICGVLTKVEAIKGKGYLASCFKRGMQGGILPNLERKLDRVSALVNHDVAGKGESLTESLADLAVYAIKGITLQSVLNPEEVEKWLEGVKNLS